ncbi:MAG: hypothetical protein VYA17_10250 [Pseudomonadota bacterium]|nr:hypothetical protein [Pseudomonadota bacterium]
MSALASTASKTISYLAGAVVIGLALAVMVTAEPLAAITSWAENVLGYSFVFLLGTLVFLVLFCWVKMLSENVEDCPVWFQSGVQAANGVTTLALTYTLLGISLGIASLSGQELTPETIQPAIQRMTSNFSLAFMTTVIGLPLSALLRGMIVITHTHKQQIQCAQ